MIGLKILTIATNKMMTYLGSLNIKFIPVLQWLRLKGKAGIFVQTYNFFYMNLINSMFQENWVNPLIHNVRKWSDTLQKSCSICCKIFKVCLTIFEHYALKVSGEVFLNLVYELKLLT